MNNTAAPRPSRRTVTALLLRALVLLSGMFLLSLGVAFSKAALLGTSPISCIPCVLSQAGAVTMGQWTIIIHVLFIILQAAILRRAFRPWRLLQLPVVILFGLFVDGSNLLLAGLSVHGPVEQWLWCAVGIALSGFGIFLEIRADLIMPSGDGLVRVISEHFRLDFSKVKIGFDCTLVVGGVILSLVLFGGLTGVGAGTIASALCVGPVIKLCGRTMPRLNRLTERLKALSLPGGEAELSV